MISSGPSSLPCLGFRLFTRLCSARHNSCVSGIGEAQFGPSDLFASYLSSHLQRSTGRLHRAFYLRGVHSWTGSPSAKTPEYLLATDSTQLDCTHITSSRDGMHGRRSCHNASVWTFPQFLEGRAEKIETSDPKSLHFTWH
jgi:hypothetical protein